jgi:hypothetical protein
MAVIFRRKRMESEYSLERCACGREAILTGHDGEFNVECTNKTCWTGPVLFGDKSNAIARWNTVMDLCAKPKEGKYITKDSGERQHFKETGAQRDTQKGKGRYDLFPWLVLTDVMQYFYSGTRYDNVNWMRQISTFISTKSYPDLRELAAKIMQHMCNAPAEPLPTSPYPALTRLAGVFERGAVKYEARNWEKGIPLGRYLDSATRHIIQALSGKEDEDHWAQALWNVLCLLQTHEMIERGLLPASLDDIPNYTPVKAGAKVDAGPMGVKHPFLDFEVDKGEVLKGG